MAGSISEQLWYQHLPPEVAGERIVQSAATGAAAANFDWYTPLGASAPKGKVWVEVTAETTVAWIRFKATGAASTTAANGALIGIGEKKKFYVNPRIHGTIDHLSTGVGVIKIQVCSPPGERIDI